MRTGRALCILPLVLLAICSSAQNLRVEYDRITGAVRYFAIKDTKKGPVARQVTQPKITTGDVIEVRVVNMNEFVFKAHTKVDMRIDSSSSNFGGTFSGFLNSSSSAFSGMNLGGFELDHTFAGVSDFITGIFGAGGESDKAQPSDEVEKKLLTNRNVAKPVIAQLDSIVHDVEQIGSAEERLRASLISRDMTLEQIRARRDSLMRGLQARVPEAFTPNFERKTSQRFGDLMAKAKVLVKERELLWASVDNSVLQTEVQASSMDVYGLDQAFTKVDISRTTDAIKTMNSELDRAKFEQTQMVAVDNDLAYDMVISVDIYDLAKLETRADGSIPPDHVIMYYSDRFKTPDGRVVSEGCTGCVPLERCEGSLARPEKLDSAAVIGVDTSNLLDLTRAYGVWSFWDKDGKLVREQNFRRAQQPEKAEADRTTLAHKLDNTRILHFGVNRGITFTPSLGIGITSLFDAPMAYHKEPVGIDQHMIVGGNTSNVLPTVASMFHFYWDGPHRAHLGGSAGIGVALGQSASFQYMMGPSLVMGRKTKVTINAGLSATQVERLDPGWSLNVPYNTVELPDLDNLKSKQYGFGIYFGVSFAVGSRQ